MADVNFKDFVYKQPEDNDFVVGYNAEGTSEIRTKISDIAEFLADGGYGATGPQGPRGLTGPAGPTGSAGVAGPAGQSGATGPQGPQGATGFEGGRGATGASGFQGATGPVGPTGPAGTGFSGASGIVSLTVPLSTLNTQVIIAGTQPGYSLSVVNRANFDPGEPLVVDGRARIVHGMNFQAGIPLFTNGSDHTHVSWSTQSLRSWQMIQNGGPDFGSLGSQFSDNQMFQLVTVGDNMGGVFFNELPAVDNIIQTNLYSVDTRELSTTPTTRSTFPYPASNLKLIFNTPSANINGTVRNLQINENVQLSFRIGFAGIVASTYPGKVTSGPTEITIEGQTKYQYVFEFNGLDNIHWLPTGQSLTALNTNFNGAPGMRVLVARTTISGTQVGLTGNYMDVPRHILVHQQNHNAYVGAPVVLSLGENLLGMVTSDYNAYVKDIINGDKFVISVGNHYLYPSTSGTASNAGWVLYEGSTDAVHQYNPALQHFQFRRFRARYDLRGTRFTGGSRSVALGNGSETDGFFTYALGYNSTILNKTNGASITASSVFGGSYNVIQSSHSTAIGGKRLKITKDNQTVTGQYNNSNTDALFVIGNGTSEQSRSNVLELSADGTLYIQSSELSLRNANNDLNSSSILSHPLSSGDGNGYTTIELHPDISRSQYDQYLIIDPTQPNHIHIRAGGAQDNSNAQLIFGGENSYVSVNPGSNPSVSVAANNNYWEFGNNGYLYFPDGGILKYKGTAPGTSKGTEGDAVGMIAIDNDYFYYCTNTYDGSANIWKRVQFSSSTW